MKRRKKEKQREKKNKKESETKRKSIGRKVEINSERRR